MSKESLVSYCGLYCGDCLFYTGSIADSAKDLRKELRKHKFDEVAKSLPFKEFKNYPECYEMLGAMMKLRCKGCRERDKGKFTCNIVQCAQNKEFEGCWECDEFETCQEFDFLKSVHNDANLKNLRKIKKQGIEGFLKVKRHF